MKTRDKKTELGEKSRTCCHEGVQEKAKFFALIGSSIFSFKVKTCRNNEFYVDISINSIRVGERSDDTTTSYSIRFSGQGVRSARH